MWTEGREGRREGKDRFGTSSSISKRVKPPYLGDGGLDGGGMAGDAVEVGGLGGGDATEAGWFGGGDAIESGRRGPGEIVEL